LPSLSPGDLRGTLFAPRLALPDGGVL